MTTNEGVPPEKIAQAAQHAEALKRAQAQAESMREARSKAIGGALPRPKLAGLGCAAFVILATFFVVTVFSSAVGIALAHRWGW
jgi:hypothetical protein